MVTRRIKLLARMVYTKSLFAILLLSLTQFPWANGLASYLDISGDDSEQVGLEGGQSSNYMVKNEKHSLLELVDPEHKFLRAHPSTIMSAAQIIYAMILAQGVEKDQYIPGYGGTVPVYKLFSHQTPITEGRRIIGQYEGIKAVVDAIQSQAGGSKSGVIVPLLVGTHGSGKTEFRSVIANAMKNLTRYNKNFYMYEIVWLTEELKKIPELSNFLKSWQEKEFRSPLHSSPITLLPQAYKRHFKGVMEEILAEHLKGSYPVIDLEADPVSTFLQDAIMSYYRANVGEEACKQILEKLEIAEPKPGLAFRPLDEVKILSQYMTIRRVVLGEPGTVPLVDAPGDDVDYQGLFMSENPIMRALVRSTHVLAWNYGGAILSGSRNLTFLDEFLRYPRDLADALLGVIESRVVVRPGSPSVPLDTVIIAATNSANLEKLRTDTRSHAQINRLLSIPFEWTTYPGEIAKILLYMNGKNLRMKKLTYSENDALEAKHDEASYKEINLDELFPQAVVGRAIETSDGRYKLVYGEDEENGVYIAPHSLMFMADFIASTRINTSVKDAENLKGGEQLIGDPIFRDQLTRLKVLKNEINILRSQQDELHKLSKKLREGSYGMSARVAGIWFAKSLAEARQAAYDYTLTPIVIRKVYDQLLNEGALDVPDVSTELKWKALMDTVAEGVLLPKLQRDIYASFHHDGKANDIYDEIIREIVTLFQDPEAKVYEADNGQGMAIDKDRLAMVGKFYAKRTGKPLAYAQIATFYLNQVASGVHKSRHNKDLLDAISDYLGDSLSRVISISDLLNFAEKNVGNRDTSEKYHTIEEILVHKLGYNKRSIIDALRVMKQYKDKLKS